MDVRFLKGAVLEKMAGVFFFSSPKRFSPPNNELIE